MPMPTEPRCSAPGFILTWYEEFQAFDRGGIREELERVVSEEKLEEVSVEEREEGIAVNIRNLRFYPDSPELLPGESNRISAIAAVLRRIPERSFLVMGHTAGCRKRREPDSPLDRACEDCGRPFNGRRHRGRTLPLPRNGRYPACGSQQYRSGAGAQSEGGDSHSGRLNNPLPFDATCRQSSSAGIPSRAAAAS